MFLITFGDDWTLGSGVWYKPGMPKIVYENKEPHYDDSWRIIVRDYLGCQDNHINFATSQSSNQRQFALAKDYFNSKKFYDKRRKVHDEIIVLWGLTTTRRDYKWCSDSRKYEDIIFKEKYLDKNNKDKLGYGLNKWSHHDDVATKELETEIVHWNIFFKALGIKNYWFDSFNSKKYTIRPSNFFDIRSNNRDLLSLLCIDHAMNKREYYEGWAGGPMNYALNNRIVNPHTFVPKKEGHEVIAKYIIEKLS
tara:strand:- start:185 stop:937 length:753 start_codon:yes stop_codon:yes gene_type:complete